MGSALVHLGVPSSAETYDAALEGLVEVNESILQHHPDFPRLYDAGVRYKVFPYDTWKNAIDINREKVGDCEGLSGWRAAELRVSGEDPGAQLRTYKTGPHKYHAVVRRGSGIIEDPSRVLGMKIRDPKGYEERLRGSFGDGAVGDEGDDDVIGPDSASCTVGEDTAGHDELTFDIYHTGRGYSGVLRLPMRFDGQPPLATFMKTSTSKSPAGAAGKALNLANLAAHGPAADLLKAAMPPQAAAALAVLNSPEGQAAMNAAKGAAGALAKGGLSVAKKLKFW